tara:strand:+ start:93 stop:668 length:576 start_codon:yes stop_codon:yes gene_type:complete
MAINWSTESSSLQVRPAGLKRIQAVDIDTSGSAHTVTGIPSDAAEVNIHLINYSTDNNTQNLMSLRCGTGGSIDSGNNYQWGCNDGSGNQQSSSYSGSAYFRCIPTVHSGASHTFTGDITLRRATHSEGVAYSGWMITSIMGDVTNSHCMASAGRWKTISALERVQIYNAGGHGYDSGGRMIVTVATGYGY